MSKESRNSWVLIMLVAAAICAVALYSILNLMPAQKPKPGQMSNVNVANQSIGGDFELTDMFGKKVNLASYEGKNLLIYFGFTNCPDICPTSLQIISNALDSLSEAEKDIIQPIFVSVDPDRDSPEKLRKYIEDNFHEKIIALTGTKKQIEDIAKTYKIYYARVNDGNENSEYYMINHTSLIYLTNGNGHYLAHFSLEEEAGDIAQKIKKILK